VSVIVPARRGSAHGSFHRELDEAGQLDRYSIGSVLVIGSMKPVDDHRRRLLFGEPTRLR